uniref:protamine-like protein n=1 Tax=Doryrhamphus excisus TaxID=161450 RepID=UPI0025AE3955|nr:protamine-like protein [Doryrhamphus excisus]
MVTTGVERYAVSIYASQVQDIIPARSLERRVVVLGAQTTGFSSGLQKDYLHKKVQTSLKTRSFKFLVEKKNTHLILTQGGTHTHTHPTMSGTHAHLSPRRSRKRYGPTVSTLILNAISSYGGPRGVSLVALKKVLKASGYNVTRNRARIRLTLRKLVTQKYIRRTRGKGASGSFKINRKLPAGRKGARKGRRRKRGRKRGRARAGRRRPSRGRSRKRRRSATPARKRSTKRKRRKAPRRRARKTRRARRKSAQPKTRSRRRRRRMSRL